MAIDALVEMGFDEGVLFVGSVETNGSSWAVRMRLLSDVIICFVPSGTKDPQARNIAWPALQWADSGKLVCGADNYGWLHDVLKLSQMALHDTLEQTLTAAWKMVAKGVSREAAEREVPLMVWKTPSWVAWYTNLKAAGNRLNGAKVNWTFRVGPGGIFVLFWAVHVDLWVESEKRSKSNEVVISRPDIACVLAYLPGPNMLDTEIVLIKEFRSPCRNEEMFVYELPGGSSFKPNADIFQTAADELFEEAGIRVGKERLEKQLNRQAAATVTTHHVHLFSCELTRHEMELAKECARNNDIFGNFDEETERTYIETMTLREAIPSSRMDFTTLGMIVQTIGLYFDHRTKQQLVELKCRLETLGLDTSRFVVNDQIVSGAEHAFGVVDSDNSGAISKAEFVAAYGEECSAEFDRVDANKDGELSRAEYLAAYDVPTRPVNKMVAALNDSGFQRFGDESRASSIYSGASVATIDTLTSLVMIEQTKSSELDAENEQLKEELRSQQEELASLKALNNMVSF